jgi:hypothetical protein
MAEIISRKRRQAGRVLHQWLRAVLHVWGTSFPLKLPKKCGRQFVVYWSIGNRAQPRTLTVRTQGYQEVLQVGRQRQRTVEFKEQYAKQAGFEGTLSQGVRAFDLRRSRYIGLAKTHLQHILIAAAINLIRVVAWLTDPRPQRLHAALLRR